MILGGVSETAFANLPIISINGQIVRFDQDPILVQGSLLAPIEPIVDLMPAISDWREEVGIFSLLYGITSMGVRIGYREMLVRNENTGKENHVQLPIPPLVIDGVLFLPIETIVEKLGFHVKMHYTTNTLHITRGPPPIEQVIDPPPPPRPPGPPRAFASLLNIAFGLGSYLQKDIAGGVVITAGYALALGLVAWELNLTRNDRLAGYLGPIGIGVAAATMIFGFARPYIYFRNRNRMSAIDMIDIRLVSNNQNQPALMVGFSNSF